MEKILVIFQDMIRCNPVTWTQNVIYSFLTFSKLWVQMSQLFAAK